MSKRVKKNNVKDMTEAQWLDYCIERNRNEKQDSRTLLPEVNYKD